MAFSDVATKERIERTIAALKTNNIEAVVVADGEVAKAKALELIPEGAEVMTMTSMTLDQIGLAKELNESGRYNASRPKLNALGHDGGKEKYALGAISDWAVGSVHAVTEDGKVLIASLTGSQLPAYAYSSAHVVWVVGAQKLVKDLDEAFQRINEYVLPLESERAHKAYGVPGSSVDKLLIINKEIMAGRLSMIIIDEAIGF